MNRIVYLHCNYSLLIDKTHTMETHDNLEMQSPQPEEPQTSIIETNQESPETETVQSESIPPDCVNVPSESEPNEEEWRERIRRAEEEGYRRGLNERASAIMAQPAPYEQPRTEPKIQEEIPFLKTIRRSVWDD